MTLGQILHAVYKQALGDQGVDSGDWEQLEDEDRVAWESTAILVDFELSDSLLVRYGRPHDAF